MTPLELLHVEGNGHHPRVVYRQEGLALIHGDAREMRELPGDSVDLVITDPPMNVGVKYGPEVDDRRSPEEYAAWTREWVLEALRVLKPGGQLYALMAIKSMPWWLPEIRDLWEEHRGHLLIWGKTMAVLHREPTYIRAYEPVLWLTKGGSPAVFHRAYKFQERPQSVPRLVAQDRDWFLGGNAIAETEALGYTKAHPTPRPVWFWRKFILRATEPGDLVLDPMVGTGSSAWATKTLGRRFIGFDIDRTYLGIAQRRVAQAVMDLGPVGEAIDASQLALQEQWTEGHLRWETVAKKLTPNVRDRIRIAEDGCWLWQGALTSRGYGHVVANGVLMKVHRLVYEGSIGPIPEGLELDHLCEQHACCNPSHLELVTHQENVFRGRAGKYLARRQHCPRGHPYDEANTYFSPRGRQCRTCQRERDRQRYRRRRAQEGSDD